MRRKHIQMEVDSTDPWATMDPSSNLGLAPVAMDEAPNPWGDSSTILGASQIASIAPSGMLNSQDDTGWADFSSAAGLGAVGGFANFEANFGMSSEEEPKDRNKNMETMPSSEDLEKDVCREDSNVIPTQSQRVPKPIGEGMTEGESEMLQPNQVGGSEGISLDWVPVSLVPATSFSVSDCNSTGPDDRFIELMDRNCISQFPTVAGDPAEPNLADESTILPESSVPSLPTNPTSEDSQQTEAARKLGSLAAEASVLPQPSTESPANGPV
ncbi:hypothetical protein J437_LFUL007382 [Ladona fulva]|uniref:Uncharacterized protein n=1 Tax=Ladona fulva TaxID=123851 RepID=A0A8K0K387_LADFU|nr:hypothetical protein J437_LFUL007382 [Ladona fulva]